MSALTRPRRAGQLKLPAEPARREGFTCERHGRERSECSDGGRLTLGQRLESVWEGLHAAGAAPCPVCGHGMERTPAGGRCGGCGSSIV